MTDDEVTPLRPARPLRIRRNFTVAHAPGVRLEQVEDDAAVLPELYSAAPTDALNRRVREGNQPLPPVEHSPLPLAPAPLPVPAATNAAERLRRLGAASTEYEREFRLRLLHQLLMRGMPLDEISQELDISMSQILRDRIELGKRLREESKALDIDFLVGENSQVYNEAQAMALQIANSNVAPATRLAAIRTALGANADKHRFLTTAGVYDAIRYRRSGEQTDKSDLTKLMEATERLFAPLPGVGQLSLDDADSNNSSDETIDL